MSNKLSSNNVSHDHNNRQASNNEEKLPIAIIAMRVPKSIVSSEKLHDLSNNLQDIDKDGILKISESFNNTPKSAIISGKIIHNAIKGLNFEGDVFPNDLKSDASFKKFDVALGQSMKKLFALNAASLILNPASSLGELPIPSLKSQAQDFEAFFQDDAQITDLIKQNIPKEANAVLDNNTEVMQNTSSNNTESQQFISQLQQAPQSVTNMVTKKIEDQIGDIYQLTAIRLLAQLGSASTGTPDLNSNSKVLNMQNSAKAMHAPAA